MSNNTMLSQNFGKGLAWALGLNPAKTSSDFFLHHDQKDVVKVTFTIYLTPEDLRKAAEHIELMESDGFIPVEQP